MTSSLRGSKRARCLSNRIAKGASLSSNTGELLPAGWLIAE